MNPMGHITGHILSMEEILGRLRQTRADMLGTPDEQHYWDCHKAADELQRLRAENAALRADAERLDWLDQNPRVIVRSGKQHIRPLIDAARKAACAETNMKAADRAAERP